ncbi:hypothetical protein [Leptolyngbya ohadii]|nr:hypothetical protein [Leptolyngbya ohadii]
MGNATADAQRQSRSRSATADAQRQSRSGCNLPKTSVFLDNRTIVLAVWA